jgi:hypothetical protein
LRRWRARFAPSVCVAGATIRFRVRERAEPVELTVVDLLGRVVATLVAGDRMPGTYDATSDAAGVPAGTYFYRLRIGARMAVKSFMVL